MRWVDQYHLHVLNIAQRLLTEGDGKIWGLVAHKIQLLILELESLRTGSTGGQIGKESDFYSWGLNRAGKQQKPLWTPALLRRKEPGCGSCQSNKTPKKTPQCPPVSTPNQSYDMRLRHNIFIVFLTPLQTSKQVVFKCAEGNSFSVALTELSAKLGPHAPLALLLPHAPLQPCATRWAPLRAQQNTVMNLKSHQKVLSLSILALGLNFPWQHIELESDNCQKVWKI